ncbi:hypothetical protein [Paenibacillus antarcticus]|uniref:Lipoprotein n=1 Tax=Paenibacillus antarcticus TaxID=253703 RepID=A0A162MFC1_9BACL|nr:hypothetical protein [Paenibacillus antarcticus]OAB48035.1 hypothetical protein PBAT_03955 [Paenibacillus antarcticus]
MRRYQGLVIVFLVLVVAGCTSASKISTDQVKAFITDVKKSKTFVKNLDVQYRPTDIEIIYTLHNNIEKADQMDLLNRSKQLVNSKSFDQEVIQGIYLNKYKSDGYPDIAILFDSNDDGEYDYKYTSIYDTSELNVADESSYAEWYYHKDMSAMGELVPLEE